MNFFFRQSDRYVVLAGTLLCLWGSWNLFSDTTHERCLSTALLSVLQLVCRGKYDGSVDLVNHFYRIAFPLGRLAFKEGFYREGESGTPEAVTIANIFDFAAAADRTLECSGFDAIDVGIGHRGTTYFTREQVRCFLQREKHKDLLVVWFTPGSVWTTADATTISDFKFFVKDLGYRRLLILGGHAEGVFVLYDSAGNAHQQKSESRMKHDSRKVRQN